MYRLRKFIGAHLPNRMLEEYFGTGDVATSYVNVIDRGAFDGDGTRKAVRGTQTITRRCIISRPTAESAHEEFIFWRSAVGQRGKLERQALPSGDLHWIWARLDAVDADHDPVQFNRTYIPVEFRWSILPPIVWRGNTAGGLHLWDGSGQFNSSGWKFNEAVGAILLTSNPQTVTVTNEGNAYVDNAIVKLEAGNYDIESFALWCSSGASWRFTGTVVAGTTLVIDCGAKSIKNNNADAWSQFQLDTGHRGRPWLRLAPGDNTIRVTVVGGDAGSESVTTRVLVEFNHGWI